MVHQPACKTSAEHVDRDLTEEAAEWSLSDFAERVRHEMEEEWREEVA